MKDKTIKYEHKANTKEYLVALTSIPRFVRMLESENKSYKKLHDWLVTNEQLFSDGNQEFPSVKQIAEWTDIESGHVSKQIKQMYHDIHILNQNSPQLFVKEGQKMCSLSFDYLGSEAQFNLGLDVIPRVVDGFYFWFIKPINGGTIFHVKNVTHSLDKGDHEIWISLTSDYPNAYMELLKEKAYLHREISFSDLLSNTSSSLEEELVKRHRNL